VTGEIAKRYLAPAPDGARYFCMHAQATGQRQHWRSIRRFDENASCRKILEIPGALEKTTLLKNDQLGFIRTRPLFFF
jgi:hypothetical protein